MTTPTASESEPKPWPPGTARIKQQYVSLHPSSACLSRVPTLFSRANRYLIEDPHVPQREIPDDDAAECATSHLPRKRSADEPGPADETAPVGDEGELMGEEPAPKKQRLPLSEKKKIAREKRKEQKGANKARKFARVQDEVALCHGASRGENCADGDK